MSPISVGYQCDKEDILGGEESQVVGGRVGATEPARQRDEISDRDKTQTFHIQLSSQAERPENPIPNPGPEHRRPRARVKKAVRKMRHGATHLKP